jgi:GNAT superfamily N-acetyltransferase
VLVQLAQSDAQILSCFPVMLQLRPFLEMTDFVKRVREQMLAGYQLAFLTTANRVVAVAGFRISQNLAYGKFLYVDDLVVDETERSHGYGEQLFNWLIKYAKQNHCQQLTLDSGVQRFEAHRFYLRHRMKIASHHFSLDL